MQSELKKITHCNSRALFLEKAPTKKGALQLNTDPSLSFPIKMSVLTVCIFNMVVKNSKFCHVPTLF